MRKQGRQAALLGLRCVSLCPPSSLPAGTVLGACGSPWDQMSPFWREGDCGKQGLPLQSSPGLGRASGQALVSEEEPSLRAAPRTSSVFSRAHSLRAGPCDCISRLPGIGLNLANGRRKIGGQEGISPDISYSFFPCSGSTS